MAKKELVTYSCRNHPERPATVRCRRCNIPLCDKCAIPTPHGVYCSNTCATEMEAFMEKAASLDTPLRPPVRFRLIRTIIKLVALAAACWFTWFLYTKGTFRDLQYWLMSVLRTVRGS